LGQGWLNYCGLLLALLGRAVANGQTTRLARRRRKYPEQAFAGKRKSVFAGCGLFAAGKRKQEMLGAAHEGIPTLVEAKREIGGAGDADSNGFADGADGEVCFAEPERAGDAEIEAIMAAANSKGSGEAAWATSEIEKASGLAMTLHQLDAFEGFKSPDENGCGDSLRLADDVQHEMSAVVEKDIDVTRSEIHRTDAWGGTAEMVTCGIAGRVGFDFDDASAETPNREIVDDDLADEEARELDGFWREFRALHLAEREFGVEIAHGAKALSVRGARRLRPEALKIVRAEEILDFRMPADVTGDEGAERDDAEMIGAGKIECDARQLGGEAFSFEGPGNFGVIEDDLAGEAAIGDQSQVAINASFETAGLFIVGDANIAKIWLHASSPVTGCGDEPVYQGNCRQFMERPNRAARC
jgi:hypothetical protein